MKLLACLISALVLTLAACTVETPADPDTATADSTTGPYIHAANDVEAGRYYIIVAGCNDCHTPGWMERPGSAPEAEWLTGMPVGLRGPWGTTYPKNLRLSAEQMGEDLFVQALHTRDALPPMPWHAVNHLSERDARAVYRYIASLGPAGQPVPEPVPPGQEPATPYIDFMPQHMERMPGGGPPDGPPGPPPAPADTTAAPTDSTRT